MNDARVSGQGEDTGNRASCRLTGDSHNYILDPHSQRIQDPVTKAKGPPWGL